MYKNRFSASSFFSPFKIKVKVFNILENVSIKISLEEELKEREYKTISNFNNSLRIYNLENDFLRNDF